jgi:rhodanese-related sulfurtransferase
VFLGFAGCRTLRFLRVRILTFLCSWLVGFVAAAFCLPREGRRALFWRVPQVPVLHLGSWGTPSATLFFLGAIMNELEITAVEVKQRLDRGDKLLLVDVREPLEHALCRIEGAVLIPMGSIPSNLQKLDTDDDVICFCHHGMRSLDVANWLRYQGVKSAKSMAGGIDRWSLEVDPKVPRY